MSLRLRLLLSLLALTAVGLLIVDAVSYSSLRSHLSQRVDQQVEAARGPATVALLAQPSSKALRERLHEAGEVRGPGLPGRVGTGGGPPLFPRPARAEPAPLSASNLLPVPSGCGRRGPVRPTSLSCRRVPTVRFETRAARRSARFPSATGSRTCRRRCCRRTHRSRPAIGPVHTFTVDARTGSTQFRAAAFRPAGSTFTAFVAVPLTDFQDTLNHVALIGGIVTAAVLIGLAVLAWWLIKLGLRPLEEMGETAGRIADGDLSQRVEETNPRTEVGRLGGP